MQDLFFLEMDKEKIKHIAGVKVEDKRVSRSVNVDIISASTIEALLRFLQVEPEDDHFGLDRKLNNVRIENTKLLPVKMKKSFKPEKVEGLKGGARGPAETGELEREEGEAGKKKESNCKIGKPETAKTGRESAASRK